AGRSAVPPVAGAVPPTAGPATAGCAPSASPATVRVATAARYPRLIHDRLTWDPPRRDDEPRQHIMSGQATLVNIDPCLHPRLRPPHPATCRGRWKIKDRAPFHLLTRGIPGHLVRWRWATHG